MALRAIDVCMEVISSSKRRANDAFQFDEQVDGKVELVMRKAALAIKKQGGFDLCKNILNFYLENEEEEESKK